MTRWRELSTEYPGGKLVWRAPDTGAASYFGAHTLRIAERDDPSGDGGKFNLAWQQGYDVDSLDCPTFELAIDVEKYSRPHDTTPTMKDFCVEHLHEWNTNIAYLATNVTIHGRQWLYIIAVYDDYANQSRHDIYRTVLDKNRFLTFDAEFDNRARTDLQWFVSRQSVMSNVLESIHILPTAAP